MVSLSFLLGCTSRLFILPSSLLSAFWVLQLFLNVGDFSIRILIFISILSTILIGQDFFTCYPKLNFFCLPNSGNLHSQSTSSVHQVGGISSMKAVSLLRYQGSLFEYNLFDTQLIPFLFLNWICFSPSLLSLIYDCFSGCCIFLHI